MKIENLQLEFGDLPSIQEVKLKLIEPTYKNVIIYSWVFIYGLILIAAIFCFYFIHSLVAYRYIGWLSLGVFIILNIFTFLWIHIEFKFRCFAIRQNDILYKSGWLFQKTTVVPYNKIQHCSVEQGLISRKYKVANLKIYTAAGNYFDVTICGLKIEEAEQLKDWLMQQNSKPFA